MASAVIAEQGGLLEHAATLAREYGVPAVFGVSGASTAIHTGDQVEVDATRGIILRQQVPPKWETI
jgi:pyruvate,water dikinase